MKTIALVGNPNSGKTTLFNDLTGSTAHVGNWPGVTVDKRSGVYKKSNEKLEIVDLPGIYSLSPYTPEEIVSRNFVLSSDVNCIINVVDATNLERNLYLTTQLLEIDVPVVIALNMMDQVKQNGDKIDVKKLSDTLGVKVIEISALKNQGLKELMDVTAEESIKTRKAYSCLEKTSLQEIIKEATISLTSLQVLSPLFHAIKLIEKDEVEEKMHPELVEKIDSLKAKLVEKSFEDDYEGLVADLRYQYISTNCSKIILKKNNNTLTKSDKIDTVLTHKIFGIPIFLFLMFLVFHLVFSEDLFFLNGLFGIEIKSIGLINFFTGMGYEGMLEELLAANETTPPVLEGIPSLGVFLQSWMGWLTGSIIDLFAGFMPEGTWYTGLLVDGLLTGIDAIFSFLPQILLLYFFISILEDSGYMARVAFIMDRAFRKFGLSGKSFIPLLMGFGCSIPAMMATKTIEDQRERDLTIRLSPFFSCGAKAPIWAMLAAVVAGRFLGDIFVFSIYIIGILIAILSAILIKAVGKKRDVSPFIMELPAYHVPNSKNLFAHLWEKLKHFLTKASTIIASSIVIIWFLSNFSFQFWNGMVEIKDSMLAMIGRGLQFLFYPLGFASNADGWKYSVAAITGLIAKEDVVATLASLGLTEATITLTNAQIYSFALFNLFTIPCFAAVATAKSESSKKGFIVTIIFWLLSSYIVSALAFLLITAFQYNIFLGIAGLIILSAIYILSVYFLNKRKRADSI